MAKRARSSGTRPDVKRPSFLWICVPVVIGLGAWFGVCKTSRNVQTDNGDTSMGQEPEAVDERFEMLRANLLSPGGGSKFSAQAQDHGQPPPRKVSFADAAYWDERYGTGGIRNYDWYGTWSSQSRLTIRPHVLPFMPPHSGRILQLGCGNSRLAEELADDGYEEIVNIDISQVVIDQMSRKHSTLSGVSFHQMDATTMSFDNNSFDAVFEKGTLDALSTGSFELVRKVVAEVFRVLRPGGVFVSLSFGVPETRKELNSTGGHSTWQRFQTIELESGADSENGGAVNDDSRAYHLYLMTKPTQSLPT